MHPISQRCKRANNMAKTQNQNQKPDHASNLQKIQHKDTMFEKFYNTNKLVFFSFMGKKRDEREPIDQKKTLKEIFTNCKV